MITLLRTLGFLLMSVICANIVAEEYFGEFQDKLRGVFVSAEPRPIFRLTTDFRFEDPNELLWSVPAEVDVDGASIPRIFWSVIGGPFSGGYINASVIHDYYCDNMTRKEHDTHRNFYYGMRASGVSDWKAKFMYWAVATFGPKWKLEKRVVIEMDCKKIGGRTTCNEVPKVVTKTVTTSSVNLDDPEVLAVVLSKASAVARSLKTSNGEVLDISSAGQVRADLDDISTSADRYRQVFIREEYRANPEELGILSRWNAGELDGVPNWKNNELPIYKNAIELGPEALQRIELGHDFKVKQNDIKLLEKQFDIKSLESTIELQQ